MNCPKNFDDCADCTMGFLCYEGRKEPTEEEIAEELEELESEFPELFGKIPFSVSRIYVAKEDLI